PVAAVGRASEPGQLELRQGGRERPRVEAGRARKLVRRRRALGQPIQHAGRGYAKGRRLPSGHKAEPEYLEHVLRGGKRRGALSQETVCPGGERAGDLAGHGEDLAAVLQG